MSLYAYFQGKIVPLEDAKLPIMTHALHYGMGVFEGIRCNYNQEEDQIYIFRSIEHFQRLVRSGHIIKIKVALSPTQMTDIALDIIRRSGLHQDMYLRPLAYKSTPAVANLKAHTLDDDLLMFAVPLGDYLDPNKGIHCQTSSWRRTDDLSIPGRAKVTGNYVNSIMAKTEAVEAGFDEAIMLTHDGHVAEGSGENIFLLVNNRLITPAGSDNVLDGITKNTIIELAKKELALETVERTVDRSEIYLADECFLSGTAAHLTPVTRMDHRAIGSGSIGPLTKKLQQLYFDVVRGRNKKYIDWCTPVFTAKAARVWPLPAVSPSSDRGDAA